MSTPSQLHFSGMGGDLSLWGCGTLTLTSILGRSFSPIISLRNQRQTDLVFISSPDIPLPFQTTSFSSGQQIQSLMTPLALSHIPDTTFEMLMVLTTSAHQNHFRTLVAQ